MPDYQNGKIYRLNGGNKFYIGSTTQSLGQRKGDHHSDAKNRRQTTKVYAFFNSIGWDNVSIELIELYPCQSKEELLLRENYYIQLYHNDEGLLNVKRSIITADDKKAQKAQWYRSEKGQQTALKNRLDNKEKVICECGTVISKGCLYKHKQRLQHNLKLPGLTK
jgi:hypothetical protein